MKITFIAGIHGVGKTSFCMERKLNSYSASDLIRKYKKIGGKQTECHEENQNLLLKAINTLQEEEIYLDGHFCLLNEKNKIVEISKEVFQELQLVKIILLICSVEEIIKRLYDRDKVKYSYDLIENFQKQEVKRAKLLSQELKIPLEIIKN